METTINQRIGLIIKSLKYRSIRAFADKIGVAQTSLNDIVKNGAEPKYGTLEKIMKAEPLISSDWLLTGEGDMLKGEKDNALEPISDYETRPRIPYTAAAGRLSDALEGVTKEQCVMVPVVRSFPTYDFSIIVNGDSMLPEYKSGDEIACKRINDSRFIQWGRAHVLDTTQGIVIKCLYDDGDSIRCVSFNSLYPPFSIPKEEVFSISLVVGQLRL